MDSITGIILAGGRSQRFGKEKALVKIDNGTLLEKVVNVVKLITSETIVVTSSDQVNKIEGLDLNVRITVDMLPGKAALGGIYTGLVQSNSSISIVVACDMPFLNKDLLKYMIKISSGFDIVIPKINSYLEPLHALYSKNCIEYIKSMIDQDKLSIYQLIDKVNTKYITEDQIRKYDPELLSIFNINTQSDLSKAKNILISLERKKKI